MGILIHFFPVTFGLLLILFWTGRANHSFDFPHTEILMLYFKRKIHAHAVNVLCCGVGCGWNWTSAWLLPFICRQNNWNCLDENSRQKHWQLAFQVHGHIVRICTKKERPSFTIFLSWARKSVNLMTLASCSGNHETSLQFSNQFCNWSTLLTLISSCCWKSMRPRYVYTQYVICVGVSRSQFASQTNEILLRFWPPSSNLFCAREYTSTQITKTMSELQCWQRKLYKIWHIFSFHFTTHKVATAPPWNTDSERKHSQIGICQRQKAFWCLCATHQVAEERPLWFL